MSQDQGTGNDPGPEHALAAAVGKQLMGPIDRAMNHADSAKHPELDSVFRTQIDAQDRPGYEMGGDLVVSCRAQRRVERFHGTALATDIERAHVGAATAQRQHHRQPLEQTLVRQKMRQDILQCAVTAVNGQNVHTRRAEPAERGGDVIATARNFARNIGVPLEKRFDLFLTIAATAGSEIVQDS